MIIFLCLLVFASCTDHAEVKVTKSGMFISSDNLIMKNYKIEKWRVGPMQKQLVSKGVRVDISFPQFSREHLDELVTKYDANAWLVKVRRRSYAVNSVLGYIYIPLVTPGTQEKSKYRRHQIKQGAFSIFYSAAAISKRFENFKCPAFDHNLYLDKIDINSRELSMDKFFTAFQVDDYVGAKVEKFSYSGNILNGGKNLVGDYSVQVALYNYESKRRKSNFVELKEILRIEDEKALNISGCEGFEIPIKEQEDENPIQRFKWNK